MFKSTIGSFLVFTATALAGAGEFLPLHTGNSWTYREAKSGESFNIEVGKPIVFEDNVYYSLRGYVN